MCAVIIDDQNITQIDNDELTDWIANIINPIDVFIANQIIINFNVFNVNFIFDEI